MELYDTCVAFFEILTEFHFKIVLHCAFKISKQIGMCT